MSVTIYDSRGNPISFEGGGLSLDAFQNSNVYYGAGMVDAQSLTTGAPARDILWALPVCSPMGFTLAEIGVWVVTGVASSEIRLGLYDSVSTTDLTPNQLLGDSGVLSGATSSTARTYSINYRLRPDHLYWVVYLCGSASGPTVRTTPQGSMYPILGLSAMSSSTLAFGWQAAHTFAALPSTFPAPSVFTATPIPFIGVKFSP